MIIMVKRFMNNNLHILCLTNHIHQILNKLSVKSLEFNVLSELFTVFFF